MTQLTWIYLFVYVICAYNVSFWLVFSEGPFDLFERIRNLVEKISPQLRKALNCMNCTPTYVGFLASVINIVFFTHTPLTPFNILLGDKMPYLIIIVLDTIFTSGIVYLIHTLQEMMERIGSNE